MNEFLDRVAAAFTPARRKVIYHLATAAVLILTLNKVITANEGSQYLEAIALALGFGGTFQLAAAHVPSDGDQ